MNRIAGAMRPARLLDWLHDSLKKRFLAKVNYPVFVLVVTGVLVLFKVVGAYCGSVINNLFDHNPDSFPLKIGGEPIVWWFSGWLTGKTLLGNLMASGIVFTLLATAVAQLLPMHTFKSRFPDQRARWGASLAAMGVVYMICFGNWFGFFSGAIQGIPLVYVFNERLKVAPVRSAFLTTFLIHGLGNCSVELIRYWAA